MNGSVKLTSEEKIKMINSKKLLKEEGVSDRANQYSER
jgi:hypothetical protein